MNIENLRYSHVMDLREVLRNNKAELERVIQSLGKTDTSIHSVAETMNIVRVSLEQQIEYLHDAEVELEMREFNK
jgi:hypothetical protein